MPSMLRTLKPTLLITVLFSLSNLHASEKVRTGFDINDVAVLFPLDLLAKALPHIALLESSSIQLISTAVYNQLMAAARSTGIAAPFPASINSPSDWSVVAYRIDPCAPVNHEAPGGACTAELRLVAQPTTPANGPADSALHLIYDIDAVRAEVYQDALVLKSRAEALTLMTTAGKPLGVHPLLYLASIGGAKEIPQLFKEFIVKHAQPGRMKKATIMGLRDSLAIDWVFLGGDIANGNWYQGKIPNLPNGQDRVVEFDLRNSVNSFATEPVDKTLSTFDFFSVDIVPTSEISKALGETAHKLENPDLTNRNTVDCLSCHSATSMRIHPVADMPFHIAGLSPQVPQGITAFPEPMSLQNHEIHWNLRALGYFNQKATVSMRTVAEAGRSADAINKFLNLENPGPDCRAFKVEVANCFAKSSSQSGPHKSTEECLSLCETKDGGLIPKFFDD